MIHGLDSFYCFKPIEFALGLDLDLYMLSFRSCLGFFLKAKKSKPVWVILIPCGGSVKEEEAMAKMM